MNLAEWAFDYVPDVNNENIQKATKEQPKLETQTKIQMQPKSQTKAKAKSQTKVKQEEQTTVSARDLKKFLLNEITNVVMNKKPTEESILFQDIMERKKKLETELNNITQELNNTMKGLAQISERFNDSYTKLIGLFSLMVGKTDLIKQVNENLYDKMRELILYYPADVIPLSLKHLIIGYFAGKQSGIDSDALSVGELIAIGSSPEYVEKLSPKSLDVLNGIIKILPTVFETKVMPYKVQLDKLQMLAKLNEMKQNHLMQEYAKLQQLELNRLQRLGLLYKILEEQEYKEQKLELEKRKIKIKQQEQKGKETKDDTYNIIKQLFEDRKK